MRIRSVLITRRWKMSSPTRVFQWMKRLDSISLKLKSTDAKIFSLVTFFFLKKKIAFVLVLCHIWFRQTR